MSDDEDEYVAFGVPMKELVEGDNIRKKPVKVEEQIVRDTNGIRRFHGAFTGGFSAGHFNTVNTPDGWYPKQFKSSRDTKAEKKQQRPEDFMDAEDLGEFGFAAQTYRTKSTFQGGSNGDTESTSNRLGSILNTEGYMEQLLKPASSSIGEKLLGQQGWKPGQGIGPKVSKKNRSLRIQNHKRLQNNSTNKNEEEGEEDKDPFMKKYKDFLFAPDDIPVYAAGSKENFFGIGYSGLSQSESVQNLQFHPAQRGLGGNKVKSNLKFGAQSGKKFSISGEAFGIGADEEDDDTDVYNQDMGQYDFSLDLTKDSRKDDRESRKSRWNDVPSEIEKLHIDGFNPAANRSMIKKHFKSMQVPSDWKPRQVIPQTQHAVAGISGSDQKIKKSRWDKSSSLPDQRKAALFPDSDKDKQVKVQNPDLEIKEEEVELPDFLQNFDKEDNSSLSSFKPFKLDEAKQLRYEQYLVCVKNGRKEVLKILQPKSMTEWERERERGEFERASVLFKPMKGAFGSRFVSAGDDATEEDDDKKAVIDEAASLKKAADMKMFGKLTRTSEDWAPANLLCVRFNVPNPLGGNSSSKGSKNKSKSSDVSNVFALLSSEAPQPMGSKESTSGDSTNIDTKEENEEIEIKVETVNDEQEAEVVKPKPPADFFHALFNSSDSSDSESENESEPIKSKSKSPDPTMIVEDDTNERSEKYEEVPSKILYTKPTLKAKSKTAQGIFANIDFDKLNSMRKDATAKNNTANMSQAAKIRKANLSQSPVRKGKSENLSVLNQSVRTVLGIRNEKVDSSSDEEYGPKLPDAMIKSIVISSDSDDSDSDDNRQRSKHKKEKNKKKKKEKKKHKDHKKKHKHKEKKKKDRY